MSLSELVLGYKSPSPVVDMVVKAKYMALTAYSIPASLVRSQSSE